MSDVCDALSNRDKSLSTIRGAVPPSRNGLSYANKVRDGDMAEELFWSVLNSLKFQHPGVGGRNYKGMARGFKRTVNIVDSTTISLIANCMSWAKHRRRKVTAKCHMRLDLQSFLPKFALIKPAKHSDPAVAYEVCSGIKAGEIVVFDKAYIDFVHLYRLEQREVFWVSRAKDNMQYKTIQKNKVNGKILRNEFIELIIPKTYSQYPKKLRLVEAIVEIDGKEKQMVFITNNYEWAASSICSLYKSRWAEEAFFKQIKQNLQLCDFLGYSENAIKWQVWSALLVYVLLRFFSFFNKWVHSFSRFITMIRAVLWDKFSLADLIKAYGTAGALKRTRAAPEQAYLPGF